MNIPVMVDMKDLVSLEPGEKVRATDLFQRSDGGFQPIDKSGMMFGLKCVGVAIKKSGCWFRPKEAVS